MFPLETSLEWARLGALPELLQTAHGSLHLGLEVSRGQTLLIRGGTSSVGLAALALAKRAGVEVVSTTRSEAKVAFLRDAGADEVIVDDGALAPKLRARFGVGVNRVLELVGASTLLDSLASARPGGIVCMTGILGGAWVLDGFRPMDDIPAGVRLTAYSGTSEDITPDQLSRYVGMVEDGTLKLMLGPTFPFEALVDAHRAMDENRANGKIVVVL